MKYSAFAALAALGMMLAGCATVVEGTTEDVRVRTIPSLAADCTLQNREGRWHIAAPGTARVERSTSPLEVDCAAPGYGPGHATAPARFNGVTFGNVVAGGLIGVGIDAATGANHYYDDVAVRLAPSERNEDPRDPSSSEADWRAPAPQPVAPPVPVAAEEQPRNPARHQVPARAWQPVPDTGDAMPDAAAAEPSRNGDPPPWGTEPE